MYPAEVEKYVLSWTTSVGGRGAQPWWGSPDDTWGEAVKAVVVADGPAPDPRRADAPFCYARLARGRTKCPKSVDFATELPRTASRKLLNRHEIRAPYWAGADLRLIG